MNLKKKKKKKEKSCLVFNYIFMQINKIRLFNEVLNQSTSSKRKYACTIFSSAVNLAYNCWIKLSLEDIDKIIDWMVKEWTLILNAWARWVDWTNATLKYVKDNAKSRDWVVPRLIQIADDKEVMEYINNYYSVITWISVNRKFVEDVPDWKIDTKDYALLKWNDLKHYLNMIKSEWD